MIRWFAARPLVGIALVLAGCAGRNVPEDAIEELPGWMTHGEEVRLTITSELLETGNTLGALDIIRQMRADGYDMPELDYLQGKALAIDGVSSEAERLLKVAQKRLPKDARPSAELCVLYADLQQIEDAVEACREATDIDPSNAAAWNNLGFLLLSAEEPEDALEAAEKAIDLDAGQPRYRNNLGMAQAALGRQDQAFRTLQSTMSRADAAYMVGLVVERFTGPDGARSWYERALEFDPNHAQAKQSLA
ncbi:MAG: tetratricopeptide repeat protein, partial [Myxococcota bacterium]